MSLTRPLVLSVVLAGALGALAGCGAAGRGGGASSSSSYAAAVRYADCMRSGGVPDFPDPSPGGGFSLRTSGIDPGSPAYESAYQACAHLQPGGTTRPAITAAQQAGMLAKARCLREHGVPSFPDPTFGPGGMGVDSHLTASWDPGAPTARRASKACLDVGTLIPGAGMG